MPQRYPIRGFEPMTFVLLNLSSFASLAVAREYAPKELGHLESDTFWVEKCLGARNELGSASQETQSLIALLLLFA